MIRDTSEQDEIIERASLFTRHRILLVVGSISLLTLVVFAFPAIGRWSSADQTISSERLRFATVVRGDLSRDISAQGVVVAAVKPTLFSPALGTITLQVMPGDSVTKSQVLATIDSPETLSLLEQQQAVTNGVEVAFERQQIQTRKTSLENQQIVDLAEVELIAARRELRQAEAAYAKNAISEFDFDMAKDNVATAELKFRHADEDARLQEESLQFELQTAQLEIERQRLAVAELQRQADLLTIRSPVTGIVGNLLVADRDAVSRNQPLLTVVDLSAFEVELQVPDAYASALQLGLEAEVSHKGSPYTATLVSVSPEVVSSQITARVRFDGNGPDNMKQNQRVSARILLDGKRDVLMVERGPFLESGGGRIAYIVDDQLAKRSRFESGLVSVSSVEIVSGLQEGDVIVVSNLADFNNAETVYLSN